MKKKNNLIHVRINYDEAIESKRDILATQIDLIKIAQAIKNYRKLRMQELDLKIELKERISNIKTEFTKLRTIFPKMQLPKIVQKFEKKKIEEEKSLSKLGQSKKEKTKNKKIENKTKMIKKKIIEPEEDLESQLRDIQEKLNKLE